MRAGAEVEAEADRLALRGNAHAGLELTDLQTEIEILQVAEHRHLLPLFGFCLDATAACLVFPLMAGGSLQTRLDLQPKDISYLQAMCHFASVPKPLTWRQKLRVVLQASEALLYLHTQTPNKPCVLHWYHRSFPSRPCQEAEA